LQDNRAVGNSRLVHMDVLNVSCEQVAVPSPWHCIKREQDLLPTLTGAPIKYWILGAQNTAGIHS